MTILCIATLVVLSIFISMHTKLRIELTIPFAMCYIILFYYTFAICGIMGTSVFLLLLCSLALYTITLWRKKLISADKLHLIITPGFAVFLFFAIFMWWFNKDMVPTQWDEFSHWALTVKDIYCNDRLGTVAGAVTHYKSYPPAMALWQYFFLHLHDTYHDGLLYYAYNMFLVCLMLPLTQNIRWKNCYLALAAIPVIFLSPYLFFAPFDSIPWGNLYMERALTFAFAYILFIYFTAPAINSRLTAIQVAMGIAVLTLLKSTGSYLGGIALLVMFADAMILNKSFSFKLRIIVAVKHILPALLLCLLANESWSWHLNAMHVTSSWSIGAPQIANLTALLSGTGEAWMYRFARSFFYFVFDSPTLEKGALVFSCMKQPFIWFGLMAVAVLLHRKQPQIIKRHLSMWLIICIGFGIYLVSVYCTYIFFLGESETTIMASVHRYVATYWLGAFCFFIHYLFDRSIAADHALPRICIPAVCLALVCGLAPLHLVETDLTMGSTRCESYAEINAYDLSERDCYSALSETLTTEDKVFILTDDDLFWHLISQYELLPTRCNGFIDLTAVITAQELSDILTSNQYTHLWLHSATDVVIDNCSAMFEDGMEAQQLYTIAYTENGVQFHKVALSQ